MSYTLSDNDRAMVWASAGQMNTAEVQALETAVANRLGALIDSGIVAQITKNNVRAAIAQELAK